MAKSINFEFVLLTYGIKLLCDLVYLHRHMIIDFNDDANSLGVFVVNLLKFFDQIY